MSKDPTSISTPSTTASTARSTPLEAPDHGDMKSHTKEEKEAARYLLLHQDVIWDNNKKRPSSLNGTEEMKVNDNIAVKEERSSSLPSGDGKLSLPPIEHVLKNIESYQNQQQLNDSQLLLEFNQRNSQEVQQPHQQPPSLKHANTSPSYPSQQQLYHKQHQLPQQYTFHSPQQRSQSMNSINQFQDPNQTSQLQVQTPHQPSLNNTEIQRPITSLKKSSSTANIPISSSAPGITSNNTTIKRSISTTPLSVSTSMNDLDYDSREGSMESSVLDSPNGSTSSVNGNNKKRTNLPRETIEILNEWILNNMDNPYPNHTQKKILLEQTGLSNVQLSNWFINKRRRRLFSNLSGNNGQPIKKKRLIDRL